MGSEIYKEAWEAAGGKIPEHWRFVSIESLLESSKSISVGVMYPGTNTVEGIPLIRVADVKDGKVIKKPDFTISKDVHNEYKRTELNGSELLITLVGNPGDCVIATPEMVGWNVARALAVLRLKNPEIRGWLRYILLSAPAKHLIDSRLNTTVQKTLNLKDIKELGIPIAPDKETSSITSIIEAVENKIELNRQMNATLEAMAQALFKSWFVDFDPVMDNALAAGNPIPDELQAKAAARLALGEARKALPSEIQALFPKAFVLSEEMGWIPEGWEYQSLYEMANYINGAAFKEKDFAVSEVALPIVKIAEIKSGITSQTKFSEQQYDPKYLINNGSILLSWSGNPDTSIDTFIWTGGLGWLNQHIFNVLLKAPQDKYFVYYQLRELKPVFADLARDKQTTGLGHFTIKDMKKLAVLKPDSQLLKAFNELIGVYFERSYSNLLEIQALARLRDTLLPKLLSGELRIPE